MRNNSKAFPLAVIVAGSLLLSGLNAGSAKAVLNCTFGNLNGCNGTENGVTFSNFALNLGDSNINPEDTIQISSFSNQIGINSSYNNGASANLTGNGNFSFTAQASPGVVFSTAQFDSTTFAGNFTFTTTIPGVPVSPLVTVNGADSGIKPFQSGVTSSNIVVAWAANSSAATNSILTLSTASVPGPLPLLGAATAFSFSRKLRQRVKARA